jgi:prepilin-type N-terminal cleavage/methylation domain-containing protein
MSGYGCKDVHGCGYARDERGFSLTELIVVMGIFLTVMLITSKTFKIIANSSSQQSKSLETQIEGVVGLEVLRADLEQAGFGLPWIIPNTITATNYVESVMDNNMPQNGYWPSGDPSTNFNDATGGVPRAILSANTNYNSDSGEGAKYIVIKSTVAATNNASKKWTNVSYAGGVKTITSWGDPARDFAATDRVIVIKNNLNATPATRELMVTSGGSFYAQFNTYSTIIRSPLNGDTYQLYGVSTNNLKMPFNRADYYISTPASMPQGCAPGTGVLYKSNISHSNGGYDPKIPLLDCVADMQIIYGVGSANSPVVNLYDNTTDFMTLVNTATDKAGTIRDQLKEIRVYILAQDGKKDILYNYSSVNLSSRVRVGESINGIPVGRSFPLGTLIGSDYKHYRWKVYTIVVRPKNLIQ